MILTLKRTPGIYLVGFMGCGKTTVGRLLAQKIGWSFVDIDHDIEAAHHCSIAEIFERQGEQAFRHMETEAIRKRVRSIQCGRPMVVALGGGAFTQHENVRLISHNGVSIWLDLPLAIVKKRIQAATHRPLARDPIRLEELYWARREAYAKADYCVTVDVDDSHVVLEHVLALPIF
jgi:shikimate kinase